jgi:hypothetical protein
MIGSGGLDKLNLEVPKEVPFRREFAREWTQDRNDKVFRKSTGGMYLVTGDLRGVGIPARISIGHKHHEKLGPKVEVLGAGEMHYSQWRETVEQIFDFDADDSQLLRVDLAADQEGMTVPEFGTMMWCKFKHTGQREYGDAETQHMLRSYNRFGAQSLYYGRGESQIKAYNKTLQCAQVLLPRIHAEEKREGRELSTFEQAFGFSRDKILTRVERRMGDRGTTKVWGISQFGDIHRLAKCDPYEQLRFGSDAYGLDRMKELEGGQLLLVKLFRAEIERNGIDRARAHARECFEKANSFRVWWRRYERYLLDISPKVTREALTEQYKRSFLQQLAA